MVREPRIPRVRPTFFDFSKITSSISLYFRTQTRLSSPLGLLKKLLVPPCSRPRLEPAILAVSIRIQNSAASVWTDTCSSPNTQTRRDVLIPHIRSYLLARCAFFDLPVPVLSAPPPSASIGAVGCSPISSTNLHFRPPFLI